MACIKLYNSESNEIRLIRANLNFDELVQYAKEHFKISLPIFKFIDDEQDYVTFSTNEELSLFKTFANDLGWERLKIVVSGGKEQCCKRKSIRNIINHEEKRESCDGRSNNDDILKIIEEHAPVFFASLGIECTAYREEVEVPRTNQTKQPTSIPEQTINKEGMNEEIEPNEKSNIEDSQPKSKIEQDNSNQESFDVNMKEDLCEIPEISKAHNDNNNQSKKEEEKEELSSISSLEDIVHIHKEEIETQNETIFQKELTQASQEIRQEHSNDFVCEQFKYQEELHELLLMGFSDPDELKTYLIKCRGDVNQIANLLLKKLN